MSNYSEIRCDCGKRILVPAEFSGKRIKCPKCKTKYRAPERISPPLIEEIEELQEYEPIVFACDCGKSFKAKPEFAGNTICCNHCDSLLKIPGGQDEPEAGLRGRIEDSMEVSRDDFFALDQYGNDFVTGRQSIPVARPANTPGHSPGDQSRSGKSEYDPLTVNISTSPAVIAEPVDWSLLSPSAYNAICRNEPTWTVFVLLAIGLLGSLLLLPSLIATWSLCRNPVSSLGWQAVNMKITESSIQTSEDEQRFMPAVQYEYNAKGSDLTGSRISFAHPVVSSRERAASVLQRYPAGTSFYGRYNEDDPSEAVLEPGMGGRHYFAILLTLLCMAAPLLLFSQALILLHRFGR